MMSRKANGEAVRASLARKGSQYTLQEVQTAVEQLDEVPPSLVVLGLPSAICHNNEHKKKFERIFLEFDLNCKFIYLNGFNRVKILLTSSETSLLAKLKCGTFLEELEVLRCKNDPQVKMEVLFANMTSPMDHLELPKKEKQFLISPPASPPDDWQPKLEATPAINYDLLAAIASLGPGESHEFQAANSDRPGIVITPSFEMDNSLLPSVCLNTQIQKVKIIQTKRPE